MTTRYKDNPKLKLQKVKTARGDYEYRKNCRLIGKKYYTMNRDCFLLKGKWTRFDSPIIAQHYLTGDYDLKDNMIDCIVEIDENEDEIKRGWVYANHADLIRVRFAKNGWQHVISEGVIPTDTYLKDLITDEYQHFSYYSTDIRVAMKKANKIRTVQRPSHYSIEDSGSFDSLRTSFDSKKVRTGSNTKKTAKLLGDRTFGIELESVCGGVPDKICKALGVIKVKDGSLRTEAYGDGIEYVTVPMSGAKLLHTVSEISKELTPRNIINEKCAMHVHVGTIRKDREVIVALFRLCGFIENDIFAMNPKYKEDEITYAGKSKNYCKKLPFTIPSTTAKSKSGLKSHIDKWYIAIQNYMLDGRGPNFENNRRNRIHPNRNKWDQLARYHWVNFMNMFISKRNTVEFRIHPGTLNGQKINSWLLLVNLICKYAEEHSVEILQLEKPISLVDVVKATVKNETQQKYMLDYIAHRTEYFAKKTEAKDYLCKGEIKEDKKFSFKPTLYKKLID